MNRAIILLLALLILCACASQPPRSVTAAQNLTSAQAQATNAALDEQAAQQAAAAEQRRLDDIAARATQQANGATAQAVNATEQARQVIARATEQARADAVAALTLEQQQINLEATKKAYIATSAALDRNVQIESSAATRQVAEIHATATVISKLQANDDDTRARDRTDADLTFLVGWCIKIGVGLVVLFALFTIVEIVRKRGAVMMVGNMPVAVDGSVVGTIYVTPLLPEPKPLLPAPAAETVRQTGDNTHTVMLNGNPAESMSQEEYDERQYWRTRTMRFLQAAMQASGPDSNRIPRYDRIGVKAADWVETTDALGQWIDKQERQPTFCLPPYETLTKLYDAIATRKIAPLPPFIRAKYGVNSGKQETGEQRKTGETAAKTAGNSPVPLLDQAIANLPGVDR